MNDFLPFLIGSPAFVGGLMANVYWYTIKDILKDNGFKASYFGSHLDDLGNFTHLINQTTDPKLKVKYKTIMFRLRMSFVAVAIGGAGVVLWMIFWFDTPAI